ncbi:MAG: arylsulfatase A-like enzyme, partial [Planctomycetota bacterium]
DFGGFWDGLDKRGLNDTSIFCFTSDHGEAFFEHGSSGHSKSTHEEQVDIPMFVRAPGLAPKVVSEEVSLIDLPRTFAELAEIPLAPEWGGRSLVQELVEQPVFSVHDDEWAIVYGKKKVFFQLGQSLEITAAYDLESDPSEMVNLVDTVDWPLELLDISKPEILRLNKRQLSSGEQELSNEMRDRLETLGYVGD